MCPVRSVTYVSGRSQCLSGFHQFPSGSNKGHERVLLRRSRDRWALDPNIFLRFPAFLLRSLFHKVHQTPLQFSFGFHLRYAIHLGGGGDVFVAKQSLHLFERKPGFLSPGADRMPKAVPANFRKTRFDCHPNPSTEVGDGRSAKPHRNA